MPSQFNIPASTPLFTGRKIALETLAGFFSSSRDKATVCCVVSGSASSGKTALVLQYGIQKSKHYAGEYRFDASSPETLRAGISSFLELNGASHLSKLEPDFSLNKKFIAALANLDGHCLLIFEGVESEAMAREVKSYFPSQNADIILTTRSDLKLPNTLVLSPALTEQEALHLVQLFLRRHPGNLEMDAQAIVRDCASELPLILATLNAMTRLGEWSTKTMPSREKGADFPVDPYGYQEATLNDIFLARMAELKSTEGESVYDLATKLLEDCLDQENPSAALDLHLATAPLEGSETEKNTAVAALVVHGLAKIVGNTLIPRPHFLNAISEKKNRQSSDFYPLTITFGMVIIYLLSDPRLQNP